MLSLVALTGVYAFDPRAFNYTIVLFIVGAAYFFLYSKHHLVAKTAEEEFALVVASPEELDDSDSEPAVTTAKL